MNYSTTTTETKHRSYVHDTQVDPTGQFVATCSSDRTVTVFGRRVKADLRTGVNAGAQGPHDFGTGWRELCNRADHLATIHKVAWCLRAKTGLFLATASADRTVIIYMLQQVVAPHGQATTTTAPGSQQSGVHSKYELQQQSTIRLFERDGLLDLCFFPQHAGFTVAVAGHDGYLRLFDTPTAAELSKVSQLEDEAQLGVSRLSSSGTGASGGIAAIPDAPRATSSGDQPTKGSNPVVSPLTMTQTSSMGQPTAVRRSVAAGGGGGGATSASNTHQVDHLPSLVSIAVSTAMSGSTVDIACGYLDGKVVFREYAHERKTWRRIEIFQSSHQLAPLPSRALPPPSSSDVINLKHQGSITSITWAPALGRRYHLVAIASVSGLHILRLERQFSGPAANRNSAAGSSSGMEPQGSSSNAAQPEAESGGVAAALAQRTGTVWVLGAGIASASADPQVLEQLHAGGTGSGFTKLSWNPQGTLLSAVRDTDRCGFTFSTVMGGGLGGTSEFEWFVSSIF